MSSVIKIFENYFSYNQGQGGWWVLAIVDILFLAFMIYQVYRILIKTHATQLIQGILVLASIYIVAIILNLSTVLWILDRLGMILIIVVVIVFQPEIRKVFSRIARTGLFRKNKMNYSSNIDTVLEAAQLLSESKRGALILFERKVLMKDIADSGTRLNADVTTNLLLSIFQFDTALHDGAVILQNERISAAGCFLPLSEQSDIKKTFGTRHRAALGASEVTDAVVLVVSEESGALSLAYESNLYYDLTRQEIKRTLIELLEDKALDDEIEEVQEGDFGA